MINVSILRDDVPEGEETLRLHLSNPVRVNLGSTIAATIVIPASSDTVSLPKKTNHEHKWLFVDFYGDRARELD